jgi:lipopolysaccharide export system protein LptC
MAGSAHTRVVATAKVVLPLVALGLFATMFLIAKQIDPDDAILGNPIVVDSAREARISTPEFAGVTADGTIVSLSADVARPDQSQPGRMTAEGVDARFEIPDGSAVDAVSGTAAVDGAAKLVDLADGVEFNTSTGYRIVSPGLTAALGVTNIVTNGPVTADGPPGHLEAGQATVTQSADDPSTYVLVFKGGVRLIYEPGN